MKEKLCYSAPEVLEMTTLSRGFLHKEIQAGRLKVKKAGSRTLIQHSELLRHLEAFPDNDANEK